MSETELDQSTEATADESVEVPAAEADNSIRTLIEAQLADADAPPEDAEGSEDQPDDDGAETPTVDDGKPPASWTEAEREAWADLPEAARDAITRRERDYQHGLKSDAELQKVIAPLAERLQDSGVHVDEYIGNVLKADAYINEQPLQAVVNIIQKYGIADQLAPYFNGDGSQPTATASAGESERIAQLEQQVRDQAELQHYTREWDAFKAEHPDAEGLREVIASKIGANPQLNYEGAYKQAKELISSFNGSVAQATEAQRIAASTKASGKAKRLDLPRGKAETAHRPASTGNLRDDITEAMRAVGLRN